MKPRPLAYATAVLLLASGALYASKRAQQDDARHTPSAAAATLPHLALSREQAAAITRIELLAPDSEAAEHKIVLEKRDGAWQLTEPLNTPASASKAEELIENLSALRVTDAIDPRDALYEAYGLADERAFHVRAYLGSALLRDLYFGESSARGQLLRLGDVPGVFSIDGTGPGSYAGYLYSRPLRSWREPAILNFEERRVLEVQIENPHGAFRFTRRESGWTGSMQARSRNGKLGAPAKSWKNFAPHRVDELLHAFRRLSADEFGSEKDRANSGLDHAEETGGVITIAFPGGVPSTIRVGKPASGPTSWAIRDSRWAMKSGPDTTLYALALWTTDWLTSDARRFEK